jgi:hypothetical protein
VGWGGGDNEGDVDAVQYAADALPPSKGALGVTYLLLFRESAGWRDLRAAV